MSPEEGCSRVKRFIWSVGFIFGALSCSVGHVMYANIVFVSSYPCLQWPHFVLSFFFFFPPAFAYLLAHLWICIRILLFSLHACWFRLFVGPATFLCSLETRIKVQNLILQVVFFLYTFSSSFFFLHSEGSVTWFIFFSAAQRSVTCNSLLAWSSIFACAKFIIKDGRKKKKEPKWNAACLYT